MSMPHNHSVVSHKHNCALTGEATGPVLNHQTVNPTSSNTCTSNTHTTPTHHVHMQQRSKRYQCKAGSVYFWAVLLLFYFLCFTACWAAISMLDGSCFCAVLLLLLHCTSNTHTTPHNRGWFLLLGRAVLLLLLDCSLGSRQAGDGHSEG